MIVRVLLAIVVAVVVGIIAALIGHGLVDAHIVDTGTFIEEAAPLLGLLAGVWYFFANPGATWHL